MTDDEIKIDLSDILMKNEITSRIKLFHDYVKTGQIEGDTDEGSNQLKSLNFLFIREKLKIDSPDSKESLFPEV